MALWLFNQKYPQYLKIGINLSLFVIISITDLEGSHKMTMGNIHFGCLLLMHMPSFGGIVMFCHLSSTIMVFHYFIPFMVGYAIIGKLSVEISYAKHLCIAQTAIWLNQNINVDFLNIEYNSFDQPLWTENMGA